MLRKLAFAAGAAAIITAAALSPTTASAKGWKHHHHHGWHGWGPGFGISFVAPGYYGYRDCYIVRRVVWTKWGKRIRRIRVCE